MSTSQVFLTETRERFLRAVLAELPAERIRELYLFAPIRQGGVESGVAVIAAELPDALAHPVGSESVGSESGDACVVDPAAESPGEIGSGSNSVDSDPTDHPAETQAVSPPPERYTVYTARYRHTQKGPDRGKWESSVVAEADAPLLSIETVVRGVQRRSGDVDPPDHMSGDDVRNALRITPTETAS